MSEPSKPPPSYGDVTGEYLALREGAGLVTGAHDVVWVRGPDAVAFLDGLVSQDVSGIAPGGAARSLLLEPQGKLHSTLWLLRGEEAVGVVCDGGRGSAVVAHLSRFRLRVDVEIEPEDAGIVEVWGPAAAGVLAATGVDAPPAGWSTAGGTVVARLDFARATLERWLLIGADVDALVAAGAVPAGTVAVDTVRIEAGEPVTGVDIDERTIPQEADLVEGAVSFTKGCYLGQELVARIDSRGRVNRALRGLRVAEAVIPPVGAMVVSGDSEVGAITSVGESLRLRAPIAMALLRREAAPGEAVSIRWEGGTAAAVVDAVPLDAELRRDLAFPSHSSNTTGG